MNVVLPLQLVASVYPLVLHWPVPVHVLLPETFLETNATHACPGPGAVRF